MFDPKPIKCSLGRNWKFHFMMSEEKYILKMYACGSGNEISGANYFRKNIFYCYIHVSYVMNVTSSFQTVGVLKCLERANVLTIQINQSFFSDYLYA